MADLPVEKRFPVLCDAGTGAPNPRVSRGRIASAQHFAWREAVRELCPASDRCALAVRMREITGQQEAAACSRHLDLPAADRPGGDAWLSTVADESNRTLGTHPRVATLHTLSDGEDACVRRLWVASDG